MRLVTFPLLSLVPSGQRCYMFFMIKENNSKEFWENIYTSKDQYVYGKEPSKFLVEYIDLLKKGSALDLGMGEGRNAIYLASQGFTVTGIDHSPTAVSRAKDLAHNSDVTLECKEASLDFFLIPLMKFDTILISDFHPNPVLMKNIVRGLTVGGTLMIEAYTKAHLKIKQDPPYIFDCFDSNEALTLAQGLKILQFSEREIYGEQRVQLIGVKTSM